MGYFLIRYYTRIGNIPAFKTVTILNRDVERLRVDPAPPGFGQSVKSNPDIVGLESSMTDPTCVLTGRNTITAGG